MLIITAVRAGQAAVVDMLVNRFGYRFDAEKLMQQRDEVVDSKDPAAMRKFNMDLQRIKKVMPDVPRRRI